MDDPQDRSHSHDPWERTTPSGAPWQPTTPGGAPWEPTTGRPAGPGPERDAGGPGPGRDAPRSAPEGFAPDEWAAALGGGGDHTECLEWCPICRTADVLRATATPELREQLNQVQREALITVRALLDHYLERLDDKPQRATRVEDIPID